MRNSQKSFVTAYALWLAFGPLGISNLYFGNWRRTALTAALSIAGLAGSLYFIGLPLLTLAFMFWVVDGLSLKRLVLARNNNSPLVMDVAAGFALVDPGILPPSDGSDRSRF